MDNMNIKVCCCIQPLSVDGGAAAAAAAVPERTAHSIPVNPEWGLCLQRCLRGPVGTRPRQRQSQALTRTRHVRTLSG